MAEVDQDLERILKLSPDAYYDILNVNKDATTEEIRKAYKMLALKLHPDRHKDKKNASKATEAFQLLGNAYETLSDDNKRAFYNSFMKRKAREEANARKETNARSEANARSKDNVKTDPNARTGPNARTDAKMKNPGNSQGRSTNNRRYGRNNTFDPHPQWTPKMKKMHAFWIFLNELERDLRNGESCNDAGIEVALFSSIAAIEFLLSNPKLLFAIAGAAGLYILTTTSEQKSSHLGNALNFLTWSNWSLETKILVVRSLKLYYSNFTL